MKHTEDRTCKFLGCLKTYLLTHPQAYKLGDKTIIMKYYDKTFICTLPVNQLAEQLLNSYGIDLVTGFIHEEIYAIFYGDTDLISDDVSPDDVKEIKLQCSEYVMKYEYIESIVESIIDSIVDNGKACSNLFNTLNGWEQKPVPEMSKSSKVKLADNREEILAEEIKEMDDFILEQNILNIKEQLKEEEGKGFRGNGRYELRDRLNMLQTEWNDRNNY